MDLGQGAKDLSRILVWPFSPQEPMYRDDYPLYVITPSLFQVVLINTSLTPRVNWKWDIDYAAPLAGLPQDIVPSTEFSFHMAMRRL